MDKCYGCGKEIARTDGFGLTGPVGDGSIKIKIDRFCSECADKLHNAFKEMLNRKGKADERD